MLGLRFSVTRGNIYLLILLFFRRIYLILEGKERHHLILCFSYNNSNISVYFVKNLLTTRVTTLPVDIRIIKSGHSLHKVFILEMSSTTVTKFYVHYDSSVNTCSYLPVFVTYHSDATVYIK